MLNFSSHIYLQKPFFTADDSKTKDNSFTGPSTRDFYSDDQSCYIMDAKSMGNIGRYLNVRFLNNVCRAVNIMLPVNQFIFRAIDFHVLLITVIILYIWTLYVLGHLLFWKK